MKIYKIIAGATIALVLAVSTLGAKAYAANGCSVDQVPLNAWHSSFTVQNDRINAVFNVSGSNCTVPVTLAVWRAPSATGWPINEQKLFDHSTQVFGPGQHTLTAKLPQPDCYFQADLVEGASPYAADGTANYDWQNGQIIDGPLRDFVIGGSRVCKPTVTPPKKTVTPPQVLSTTTQVTTLPNTGISGSSILGIGFAVALLGTAVHQFVQRRLYRS